MGGGGGRGGSENPEGVEDQPMGDAEGGMGRVRCTRPVLWQTWNIPEQGLSVSPQQVHKLNTPAAALPGSGGQCTWPSSARR